MEIPRQATAAYGKGGTSMDSGRKRDERQTIACVTTFLKLVYASSSRFHAADGAPDACYGAGSHTRRSGKRLVRTFTSRFRGNAHSLAADKTTTAHHGAGSPCP